MLRLFVRDEAGATAVEYGMIVAVLTLAIVGGIGTAMDSIEFLWDGNASGLTQALTGN